MNDSEILGSILKDVKRKMGTRAHVGVLGDGASEVEDFIPSSLDLLNWSIGGGAPVGRLMEIFGDVATGKTLLLLDILAHNQQSGGMSFYEDAEYGTSKDFAKRLCHIDETSLGHVEVESQEDAWEVTDHIIKSVREKDADRRLAIGLDSLAALCAREVKDATFQEQSSIAPEARIIRRALRKLTSDIANQCVSFIFTNHEIYKIGAMAFAEKTQSWGGTAPKYMASVRLKLDTMGKVNNDGDVVGMKCRCVVYKNRFDPPGRKIDYTINLRGPNLGIDNEISLVDFLNTKHAVGSRKGFVEFEGAYMRKGVLVDKMRNDPKVMTAIREKAHTIFLSCGNTLEEDADIVEGA